MQNLKHVHFIGILGSGMLALAKLMVDQGIKISGEDNQPLSSNLPAWFSQVAFSQLTEQSLIEKADLVVYSTAIPKGHPSLLLAEKLDKNIIHRSKALDILTGSRQLICITGTHGKTTCSALMAWIFKTANQSPSFYIGGIPNQFDAAVSHVNSKHFIIEADESDGSLINYMPHGVMITNIEPDHLEHHQSSVDVYNQCFASFMQKPQVLIMNADDDTSCKLMTDAQSLNIKTIGFTQNADYCIKHVAHESDTQVITIINQEKEITVLKTPLLGQHNTYNVAMCWLLARTYDIDETAILSAIKTFNGVGRRNTTVGYLTIDQHTIPVIDDYGHHPTECRLMLEEYKRQNKHIIHVFEPHRFSRFNYFFDAFRDALLLADHTVIMPVFAAGEDANNQLNADDMCQSLIKHNHPASTFKDNGALMQYIKQHHQPNTIVLFQGAGSVTQFAKELIKNNQYAATS